MFSHENMDQIRNRVDKGTTDITYTGVIHLFQIVIWNFNNIIYVFYVNSIQDIMPDRYPHVFGTYYAAV